MDLYIPFIHKLLKKEKDKPVQIPLYIDNTPAIREKLKEEEKESIFIIELF
jgi:hypothetical protein